MIPFFKRSRAALEADTLGRECVALRLADGEAIPAAAVGVAFGASGNLRRISGLARLAAGEQAVCFHPGPYRIEIAPFASAPEIGLAVTLAVDVPDPRVVQQRFDLYLVAEAPAGLPLAVLAGRIEDAVQRELAQGNLELPPCTSLEEWNAFRTGFNRLLYTRFGLAVDDCVPVDLGERVDYAALLRTRTEQEEPGAAPLLPASAAIDSALSDVQAQRRLFLELPCVMCALRLVTPAPGAFGQQQALLQRLDLAAMQVNTMPALDLAAPGQVLACAEQTRRARASLRAVAALDEAWSWLARVGDEADLGLFGQFDRIAANLALALEERRAACSAA